MAHFSLESGIILLLSVCTVTSNSLILLILFKTDCYIYINKYFFISMTAADLAIGIFIIPFSFWAAFFDTWIYGDRFCHFEAYLSAILWMGALFSLTWLCIDHYVTIRNPERQTAMMSPLRSMCWVAMIWVASVSFCCPALFGIAGADYQHHAYLCMIDWHGQRAYLITSGLLVVLPPFFVFLATGKYLLSAEYEEDRKPRLACSEATSRHYRYVSAVTVSVVYVVVWLPNCAVQLFNIVDEATASQLPHLLQFSVVWLAIGNSLWKFWIYVLVDPDFRLGLSTIGILFLTGCRAER